MSNIIKFPSEIICGIIVDGIFSWYVTDKEIWLLDYVILDNKIQEAGYDITNFDDGIRNNFKILTSENIKKFLLYIENSKISSDDLNFLLRQSIDEKDDSWYYEYKPSLFINFDDCVLYSYYSEPESFEDYVPSNWTGLYQDFLNIIPFEERYWICKGRNLFERRI